MRDIWDGIPEAEEFCMKVIRNIDQYELFPGERFAYFAVGIMATTGIDAHGESFDIQGLIDAANQINNRRLWTGTMHDPTIQPIGRAIAAFEEGAQSALLLIEKFSELGFENLVYEYNEKAKKWLPLHAATAKRGVISNRPQLIAMDQLKGFRLGGVAHEVTLTEALPQQQLQQHKEPGAVSAKALVPNSSMTRQSVSEKQEKGRITERRAVKKGKDKKRK